MEDIWLRNNQRGISSLQMSRHFSFLVYARRQILFSFNHSLLDLFCLFHCFKLLTYCLFFRFSLWQVRNTKAERKWRAFFLPLFFFRFFCLTAAKATKGQGKSISWKHWTLKKSISIPHGDHFFFLSFLLFFLSGQKLVVVDAAL